MQEKSKRIIITQIKYEIWWARKVTEINPKFIVLISKNKANETCLLRN